MKDIWERRGKTKSLVVLSIFVIENRVQTFKEVLLLTNVYCHIYSSDVKVKYSGDTFFVRGHEIN